MNRAELSLFIFLIFSTYIIPQSESLKAPLLPLHNGNGWMYYHYLNFQNGENIQKYYSKILCGPDSLFPDNKIYYRYNGAWLRNEGDSIVYTRYQDGDSVYINMNWEVDSTYIQWMGVKSTTIKIMKKDTINAYNVLRKRIQYWYKVNYFDAYLEDFVQGLGVTNQDYSTSMGPIERANLSLKGYLFYDSTGNYEYVYLGGGPHLTRSFTEDHSNKRINIDLYVEHLYDDYYYNDIGYMTSYAPFIDSAWTEYYYQKGDTTTQILTQKLDNENGKTKRDFTGTIQADTSLLNNGYTLKFRMAAVDKALKPNIGYSQFYRSELTGVEGNDKIVYSYKLNNNYPNPFNPSTTISFEIPNDDRVTLTVYDVLGNKVKTLLDEYRTKGINNVVFNADNLSSEVYFYQIRYRGKQLTRKMNLIK